MGTEPYRVDADAVIELADVGFPGGEIRVDLNVPIAVVVAFQKAKAADEWGIFVDKGLRGWNLVDKDGPIPLGDPDGRIGFRIRRAITAAWWKGLVEPPAPLPQPPSEPTT